MISKMKTKIITLLCVIALIILQATTAGAWPLLPVADAGSDQTVAINTTVYFDGSGSYDPDNTDIIDIYEWDLGSGASPAIGYGVNPSCTYSTAGVKTVTLLVIDDESQTDQDTCTITVFNVAQSPAKLWWFNGQDPANYAIEVTLTAQGATTGTFKWDVVAGTDKVDFENNSDTITKDNNNTVTVKSTAKSTAANDVTINFTYNGKFICSHHLSVYAPDSLNHISDVDNSDATWGYDCKIHYSIRDQFGNNLPNNVEINEKWTTGVVADYACMDWRRGSEGSATVSPTNWYDHIQGETSTHTPTPQNPQSPLGSTKVYHWGQAWYVGSLTIGDGKHVQTNTLQKYQDHARHE